MNSDYKGARSYGSGLIISPVPTLAPAIIGSPCQWPATLAIRLYFLLPYIYIYIFASPSHIPVFLSQFFDERNSLKKGSKLAIKRNEPSESLEEISWRNFAREFILVEIQQSFPVLVSRVAFASQSRGRWIQSPKEEAVENSIRR